jgi:hypothetical protein
MHKMFQVPGTKIMSEKKDSIKCSINEINNGATLILKTKDNIKFLKIKYCVKKCTNDCTVN